MPRTYINGLSCYFLGTIKHYDGVILPEVKDKTFSIDSNVGFRAKAKNAFGFFFGSQTTTSGSEQGFIDAKSLSQPDHVALRKRALKIYLNGLRNILHEPESINDPINVIRTVHSMYLSLHNSCVTYKYYMEQKEIDWRLKETTDVSSIIIV